MRTRREEHSQPEGEVEREISVVILLLKREQRFEFLASVPWPISSGCFVLGTDSISSQFMHE